MIDPRSNWEEVVQASDYHFDADIMDPRWDTVIKLGKIDSSQWGNDIEQIIANSTPRTLETRGRKGDNPIIPEQLAKEEYDLERLGIDPKTAILTNMNLDLPEKFLHIVEQFKLDNVSPRLTVQQTGQMWFQHIDKLVPWYPENPERVMRIFIPVTDWVPGQFWAFGNYTWSHWKAGDVVTFDWRNVPHSTANTSWSTRITLQITGIKTDKTEEYLSILSKTL